MTPYYNDGNGIVIYHGRAEEVLPTLGRFDLLLTDPNYGIGRDKGMGGKGYDGFGNNNVRHPKQYPGEWDSNRANPQTLTLAISICENSIVWGGNYFSDCLPVNGKWLVWDKEQTMPSFSDAELAWTNFSGVSVRMFRYNGSGLMAKEKARVHPTQKPLALMQWCIKQAPNTVKTILDPYGGSMTTLAAAKLAGLSAAAVEQDEKYIEAGIKRLRQGVLNFTE